jgi:ribonuclease Z
MKIALMGSASAVCSADRDNTALAVETNGALILIDCVGSPVKKLLRLGFDLNQIDNILLTHWHPDHVYGLPSLVHEMLLLGRTRKLTLFLPRSSQRIVEPFVRALFVDLTNLYAIEYRPMDKVENVLLWRDDGYAVYSTPVLHSHDTLAYKIVEHKRADAESESASFVYSSDTKPNENLVRLARGADLLVHECTYLDGEPGAVNTTHSNARQVGEIAARAAVKKLALVHLGIEVIQHPEIAVRQVLENFAGEVVVGEDMMVFEI